MFILTEDCTNSGNVTVVSESRWLRAGTITKTAVHFISLTTGGRGIEAQLRRSSRERPGTAMP